ncbi:MAG TPA: hypothetical protein DCG57_18955 [Candidatus Riflebacteria bacterium]|nr:hypothetical protein [Candidatus Riflebacteria bacterium]
MSRSYRINIPVEVLLTNDRLDKLGRFSMPFDLMQILSLARMQELLKQALLRAGGNDTANGVALPCADGKTAVVDVENLKIRLEVQLPDEFATSAYEENIPRLKEQIQNALDKGTQIDSLWSDYAEKAIAEDMARQLRDLALAARQTLNSAIKEAYSEAIKEKAAQLGSVSAISESSDGSTTRIRIEVSV